MKQCERVSTSVSNVHGTADFPSSETQKAFFRVCSNVLVRKSFLVKWLRIYRVECSILHNTPHTLSGLLLLSLICQYLLRSCRANKVDRCCWVQTAREKEAFQFISLSRVRWGGVTRWNMKIEQTSLRRNFSSQPRGTLEPNGPKLSNRLWWRYLYVKLSKYPLWSSWSSDYGKELQAWCCSHGWLQGLAWRFYPN